MDLKAYLEEKRRTVDEALMGCLPTADGSGGEVTEAMKYSLFAGGKRLRPILCMAGAEAVGGDPSSLLPVACALELIHTYSLIHDDLPVMDDDDMRRGKPTNHKVFGEAVALLAGDGLLTEAFRLMAGEGSSAGLEPRRLLRAIALIGRAAGWEGMVGGQVVDILSEGKEVAPDTVEFIHTHKTGALITASVVSGALLGGGDDRQGAALTRYGENIGLAFQIADDILDIEGDSALLGKGVGADARKKKITYPTVMGLEASRKIEKEMIREALEALRSFDHRADPLRRIASYIIERKK
ncbi:MAG: polyprenyl synthetase family protein [Deltaproteobacteria bacterium]|nr:polyprenyl synthetase family protein [Deltaproteobacteria bacterium]